MMKEWEQFNGNKEAWNLILAHENEPKFRQLYEWGQFNEKSRGWKTIRLIRKDSDLVTTKCQLFIKQILFVVFIFIPDGFIGDKDKIDCFFLKKIKSLYPKKIIYLRIHPWEKFKKNYSIQLLKNGFSKTIFSHDDEIKFKVNLKINLESILIKAKQKWRYNYKKSLGKDLSFKIESKLNSEEIVFLAKEHALKKKYKFKMIKSDFDKLNLFFKKNIVYFKCIKNDEIVDIRVGFIFNNIFFHFLSLQNDNGIRTNSGYFSIIKLIEYLKEKNLNYLDLNRVNKKNFFGVYRFKEGLCRDGYATMGEWHWSNFIMVKTLFDSFLKISL